MTEYHTLRRLIDQDRVASALRRGSSARHAIASLQTLLHWLGFDRRLAWQRYGADGDYGRATAAAVAEFARRNGSRAAGNQVSLALAERILARYDSLEELKQLAADVDAQTVERYYRRRGPDRIRIAALQTLLHDLGLDAELHWARFGADGDYGRATAAAVAALARREGIDGNGEVLSLALAQRIVDRLARFYGDGWRAPAHSPTPMPGSLSITSVLGQNNRQFFEVSNGVRRKRFGVFRQGLYTIGDRKLAAFVESNADSLRALGVTPSEVNVMIAVAENEGNLDAVNSWDSAFLSFGMFQWTAGQGGAKGELPALLARLKDADQDLFDEYFGQHGLDVTAVTADAGLGRFTLNGVTLGSADAKEQLRQASWAFYCWLAGQDQAVQAIEVKHALGRLDRFYSDDGYRIDDRYFVSDLVTSEYGVGLVLDQHVNRPAHVRTTLSRALRQAGLGDPAAWDTADERRFIDAYLAVRAATTMTDAEKRARVTRKYLTRGIISDQRGSFRRAG